MIMEFQYLLFTILITISSIIILKLKILDFKGTISSIFIGNLIYLTTGINGFILILQFFIIGFIFTKYKFNQKRIKGIAQEKGGIRSWDNVIANGFGFSLFALIYFITNSELFLIGFISSIAIATGDTLATEIGLLSKNDPKLITNLKKVEAGRSGGITTLGLIASFFGILSIIISSLFVGFIVDYYIILIIIIGSFLGILIDSIIGATVQSQYYCKQCNKYTELAVHHNKNNELISGLSYIDNNIVNLLSIMLGSSFTILIIIFI